MKKLEKQVPRDDFCFMYVSKEQRWTLFNIGANGMRESIEKLTEKFG